MRFLGYIWAVISNLIALLIILAAISVTNTKVEVVIVAGLVLLHVNLGAYMTNQARAQAEMAQGQTGLLVRILKATHDPGAAMEERGLREALEAYQRMNVRFYINLTFSGLTWLLIVGWLVLTLIS
jgi:hypothetical protein